MKKRPNAYALGRFISASLFIFYLLPLTFYLPLAACACHSRLYSPSRSASSSYLPLCVIFPSSSTYITSALRTVETVVITITVTN